MNHLGILRAAVFAGCGVLASACADQQAPPSMAAPALAKPAAGRAYLVVERGQSLDKIAQSYHVAKRDLIAANHLQPPYTLTPGAVLEIPPSTPGPVAKAKTRPKKPVAAEREGKPVRTAGVPASERPVKPKPAEPAVIPLD